MYTRQVVVGVCLHACVCVRILPNETGFMFSRLFISFIEHCNKSSTVTEMLLDRGWFLRVRDHVCVCVRVTIRLPYTIVRGKQLPHSPAPPGLHFHICTALYELYRILEPFYLLDPQLIDGLTVFIKRLNPTELFISSLSLAHFQPRPFTR